MNDVTEKNINRPIIAQLDISSGRNKFYFLESEEPRKHLDLLLISDTKTGGSFPLEQFLLDGFSRL